MRRSTPNSDLSHERFTAGENQETKLHSGSKNCFSKHCLLSCETQVFVFNIMQAKKRKHIGNNEETVTLNI